MTTLTIDSDRPHLPIIQNTVPTSVIACGTENDSTSRTLERSWCFRYVLLMMSVLQESLSIEHLIAALISLEMLAVNFLQNLPIHASVWVPFPEQSTAS